jgi:hypothetical protein
VAARSKDGINGDDTVHIDVQRARTRRRSRFPIRIGPLAVLVLALMYVGTVLRIGIVGTVTAILDLMATQAE